MRHLCRLLFTPLLLAGGCKAVEPAPEDLDGLFHWFWTNYDEASDADLLEAVANAHDAMSIGELDEVVDGSLSDFTRQEMDVVGMREDADPEELAGLYLLNAFPCTVERLDEIVIAEDQMSQYDGAYDSYERTYTSDDAAYRDRSVNTLSFTSDIAADLMGPYTQTVRGTARWVPASDDFPYGPAVVARYWMPEEAVFEADGTFFTQDYQLEVYYEREPGDLAHLYGLWRNMGFGNASTESETISRMILNALADWDDRTEELCAAR